MKKLVILTSLLLLIFSVLGCSSGLYSGSPKRGIIADGIYTNDYFKLSFTIPEGWHAYTDEEVYESFGFSMATDEDIANSEIGFGDVFFYKTVDQKDAIDISYRITVEENITNEQIRNRYIADTPDFEFGDIEFIKIGEADYAMISGSSSDGTLNNYYVWDQEVCGYLRPIINIQLTSGDSVYDILKNFTQTVD